MNQPNMLINTWCIPTYKDKKIHAEKLNKRYHSRITPNICFRVQRRQVGRHDILVTRVLIACETHRNVKLTWWCKSSFLKENLESME